MRTINAAGLAIVKEFEGCKLVAYRDCVNILTIGWGHVDKNVYEGQVISQEEADELLLDDLAVWEHKISSVLPGLSDNQFSALVSLCFNVGQGPLLGHVGSYIKDGDFEAAGDAILAWDHAGGAVVEGLKRRREAERSLFLAA